MVNTTKQVGEKIYVGRFVGYEWHWTIATVIKVTPTGIVEVEFQSGSRSRFNTDGKEIGRGSKRYKQQLDKLSFQEREALRSQEQREKDAANAIRDIKAGEVNWRWGKESMMEEIKRLQALLDIAKADVEAI